MADWIKNMKDRTKLRKFEKFGDSAMHYSQPSRFGVIKFRNIVKHVLSTHVKKVRNQHSEKSHCLSNVGIDEADEI